MGAGGGKKDINYGSTVWAAPVPLPCSRRLYLPCVIWIIKNCEDKRYGTTALPVSVRAGRAVVFILYGAILADITCPKLHAVR